MDVFFDEDKLNLIVGLVNKLCWIYFVFKQFFDWVIWVYGEKEGLCFMFFCFFNWMGLWLDSLSVVCIGSLCVIMQLILNLVEGMLIKFIDGGQQKCCFIDICDGIEVLFCIIVNEGDWCDGKIINIGIFDNEVSIQELVMLLFDSFDKYLLCCYFLLFVGFQVVVSCSYYGKGYQDVVYWKFSIDNVRCCLGWELFIVMCDMVEEMLDFFLCSVDVVECVL